MIDNCCRSFAVANQVLGDVEIVAQLFVAGLRHGRSALETYSLVFVRLSAGSRMRVAGEDADDVSLEREDVVLIFDGNPGRLIRL